MAKLKSKMNFKKLNFVRLNFGNRGQMDAEALSPTKNKWKMNKRWGLSIFGGLAGLVLLVFLISDFSTAKECTNGECFIDAANNCKNAFALDYKDNGEVFRYSTNNCVFEKKMLVTSLDEPEEIRLALEGKSLSCKYYKGEFNDVWLGTLASGLEDCEGELKTVIEEMIALSVALSAVPESAAPIDEAMQQIFTQKVNDRLSEGEDQIYIGEEIHAVVIDKVTISYKENVPSLVDITVDGVAYYIYELESAFTPSGLKVTINAVYEDGSVEFTLESLG